VSFICLGSPGRYLSTPLDLRLNVCYSPVILGEEGRILKRQQVNAPPVRLHHGQIETKEGIIIVKNQGIWYLQNIDILT
jgi:hypothetical protein